MNICRKADLIYFALLYDQKSINKKKAPVHYENELELSKFGRHKQTRTADLYHVKVAL